MYQQLILEACFLPNGIASAYEPVFHQWFPANSGHEGEEWGGVGNSCIDMKMMTDSWKWVGHFITCC